MKHQELTPSRQTRAILLPATLILLSLCLSCATASYQPSYDERVLEVVVPRPPEDAARWLASTMVILGLNVEEASTMRVTSSPFILNPGAMLEVEATYYAQLQPQEASTMVKLSATWRSPDTQALADAISGVHSEAPIRPVTRICTGACGDAWELMLQLVSELGGGS